METTLSSPDPSASAAAPVGRYLCGSLVYTRAGLFKVFFWLLCADFSFTLMGNILSNILPLLLKSQGATNTLVALIMTTIPSAMNFVLNPVISTASDRYRSRWGRRIPFIFFSTPFIVLFLVLFGFSADLGKTFHTLISGTFPSLSAEATAIGLIGLLAVGFRFFNLFVGTSFWYLFNDVVPAQFMGRFLGFFRVISSFAEALFNLLLLQYAQSHTALLFGSIALLYGVTFTLMTWNVREGDYPPPSPVKKGNPIEWIRIFAIECLKHPIFRRTFAYNTIIAVSAAMNIFALLMALSIGLNLKDFGLVTGMAAFVSMLLMYPMGFLVDRFHPIRVMLVAKIAFCLIASIQFVFLFHEFSKSVTFWIYASVSALIIPINVANTAAGFPLLMRLFPQEKFGQFCAANAMCVALGIMVGGTVAGVFLDLIKRCFAGEDYCYRFVPVWSVVFTLLALGAMILVLREWKRLGGDEGYVAPRG